MPLLIVLLLFAVLFSCECCWFEARRMREESRLRRYEQVEHPRFSYADRYIDLLA